jgi:hypothetical protein
MKKDTSMNKKIIIGTLMGCLFGATVGYSASVINLPHTFTAGTAIKASEVNANFSALAQEIASVKNSAPLNASSDFTEMAITPISAVVGSTVVVGSQSFVIKQKVGLEDPITGKKYTLNYPQLASITSVFTATTSCKTLFDTNIAVRLGNGNGFTSYVSYHSASTIPTSDTRIYIQIKNICTSVSIEQGADATHATATAMIDRATELQKYISVQEI